MLRAATVMALAVLCGISFASSTSSKDAPTVPLTPAQYDAQWAQRLQLEPGRIEQTSMKCGLPPLAPLGCRVGPCVCDQTGQNCQWQFICN